MHHNCEFAREVGWAIRPLIADSEGVPEPPIVMEGAEKRFYFVVQYRVQRMFHRT